MPYKRKGSGRGGPMRKKAYTIIRYKRAPGPGLAYAGGRRTKRGRTRFTRSVRRALLKTTETCYRSRTIAQGTGASINHDTLRKWTLWEPAVTDLLPPQGLGDGNRVGDEIYVTGIKIRMQFEMPQDRRNTKIKLWYVPGNGTQGWPDVQADFQHNVSGNTFLDPVQTKRWPGIKYLGMYQLKATDQTTGVQDKTLFVDKWLPIYRKVSFKEDGSQVITSGMSEFGFLVATAYDTYSTFQTDTVVSRGEITATLYYKDP